MSCVSEKTEIPRGSVSFSMINYPEKGSVSEKGVYLNYSSNHHCHSRKDRWRNLKHLVRAGHVISTVKRGANELMDECLGPSSLLSIMSGPLPMKYGHPHTRWVFSGQLTQVTKIFYKHAHRPTQVINFLTEIPLPDDSKLCQLDS